MSTIPLESLQNPWELFNEETVQTQQNDSIKETFISDTFKPINYSQFSFFDNSFYHEDLVQCKICNIYTLKGQIINHYESRHVNSKSDSESREPPKLPSLKLTKSKSDLKVSNIPSHHRVRNTSLDRKANAVKTNRRKQPVSSPSCSSLPTNLDKPEESKKPTPVCFFENNDNSLKIRIQFDPKVRQVSASTPPLGLDTSNYCCCKDSVGNYCQNSILCTAHSIEQKKQIHRSGTLYDLMKLYKKNQFLYSDKNQFQSSNRVARHSDNSSLKKTNIIRPTQPNILLKTFDSNEKKTYSNVNFSSSNSNYDPVKNKITLTQKNCDLTPIPRINAYPISSKPAQIAQIRSSIGAQRKLTHSHSLSNSANDSSCSNVSGNLYPQQSINSTIKRIYPYKIGTTNSNESSSASNSPILIRRNLVANTFQNSNGRGTGVGPTFKRPPSGTNSVGNSNLNAPPQIKMTRNILHKFYDEAMGSGSLHNPMPSYTTSGYNMMNASSNSSSSSSNCPSENITSLSSSVNKPFRLDETIPTNHNKIVIKKRFEDLINPHQALIHSQNIHDHSQANSTSSTKGRSKPGLKHKNSVMDGKYLSTTNTTGYHNTRHHYPPSNNNNSSNHQGLFVMGSGGGHGNISDHSGQNNNPRFYEYANCDPGTNKQRKVFVSHANVPRTANMYNIPTENPNEPGDNVTHRELYCQSVNQSNAQVLSKRL